MKSRSREENVTPKEYIYVPSDLKKGPVFIILSIVFAAILWFIPSPEKWLTFGLFATILTPVTYAMLKKRKIRAGICISDGDLYTDEEIGVKSGFQLTGYIPGVRD